MIPDGRALTGQPWCIWRAVSYFSLVLVIGVSLVGASPVNCGFKGLATVDLTLRFDVCRLDLPRAVRYVGSSKYSTTTPGATARTVAPQLGCLFRWGIPVPAKHHWSNYDSDATEPSVVNVNIGSMTDG